jgi:8-amino-7-oxononanoate synthase
MDRLKADLQKRSEQGLYRRRLVMESAQSVETQINGQKLLSFCSNDYLGLANHPLIKQAFKDATDRFGVGSGSAHLVNGHSQLHHDCERKLAEFTGRERALLFSTGYMANLAITAALLSRNDYVFQDKLNHASLIDSAQLSRAKFLRYAHNDLAQLQQQLNQAQQDKPDARRLIMTDAVFSMDGDFADIKQMARLAEQSDSWLMIDDAHGFGVLGRTGAGLCEAENLSQKQVPVLMATLGKAVGVSGAFVAGSDVLIETLIQRARSYIFTTASPPAVSAAVMKSIDLIKQEAWRREKLQHNIDYFKQQAALLGIVLMPSDSAIQPVVIGDNHACLSMSQQLFDQGVHVAAIRPPTVPEGSARLRITLSAAHEFSHIDRLLKTLSGLLSNQ